MHSVTSGVQESMRMLPVLTGGTNRTTSKPIKLGSLIVPAGTMVWIPFSALFNSPHNWEAPEKYDPVRFKLPAHLLKLFVLISSRMLHESALTAICYRQTVDPAPKYHAL